MKTRTLAMIAGAVILLPILATGCARGAHAESALAQAEDYCEGSYEVHMRVATGATDDSKKEWLTRCLDSKQRWQRRPIK